MLPQLAREPRAQIQRLQPISHADEFLMLLFNSRSRGFRLRLPVILKYHPRSALRRISYLSCSGLAHSRIANSITCCPKQKRTVGEGLHPFRNGTQTWRRAYADRARSDSGKPRRSTPSWCNKSKATLQANVRAPTTFQGLDPAPIALRRLRLEPATTSRLLEATHCRLLFRSLSVAERAYKPVSDAPSFKLTKFGRILQYPQLKFGVGNFQ